MKLKSILTSLLAVTLLVGLTVSCEDEFKTQQQQDVVKSFKDGHIPALVLEYPATVMHDMEFDITFSHPCGHVTLERAYVMVEEEMVYTGLDCDMPDLLWEPVSVEGDCGNGTATEMWEDYGVYTYRVVVDPSEVLSDDPEPIVLCEACAIEVLEETEIQCFQVIVCRTETAFGGDYDPMVEKGAWFFVFDTDGWNEILNPVLTQNITADSDVVIGTVSYDGVGFTIEFTPDWMLLVGEEESVKVGGFAEVPGKRPSGGKLGLYKGTVIEDAVLDDFRYYVIHLDVQTCNPLNF